MADQAGLRVGTAARVLNDGDHVRELPRQVMGMLDAVFYSWTVLGGAGDWGA